MKKLTLLALSAVMFTSGLCAMTSDIFVTNMTGKPLKIEGREKHFYRWDGAEAKSEQAGPTLLIYPGQEMVKIGTLPRYQSIATSTFGGIELSFKVNGQEQSFMSAKMAIGFASTMSYTNGALGFKNTRLPLTTEGLKITPKYTFGKIYQDVVMEFNPALSY